MISVNGLSKGFGSRTLFDNVSVKFTPGNRYGLTGPNGAGKSTFMKILTGEVEATNSGTVHRPKKVGVLKQDQFAHDNDRIVDAVIMGNGVLWSALQERDALCEIEELSEDQIMRLSELEGIISEEGGYTAEFEAGTILRGIGLPDDQHENLMSTLPSDYKFRVLLAQALFGGPLALLLDEPTNHLDLESIHWLEEFLCEYEGIVVVISHDRHFLNSVCTHIADIDYDTIILYPGSYNDMVESKLQARQSIESDNKDKAKKILQLQEFVARFAAGQRSSQVQSRKKEIQRLAPGELKRSNIQRPYIRFEQLKPTGREVLQVRGLTKGFDGNKLFEALDLDIARNERIAIIGANGVGKTTLLRCLMGELEPDAGSVKWHDSSSFSYYPQDYHDAIKPGSTALEWLTQFMTDEGDQYVRGLLGRMLFSGEDSAKTTETLSGGEASRLLMARLMMQKNPILILDEPTNHLDLEAVSALGEGLTQFPGTVFVVSHDRDLIAGVATRVLSFVNGKVIDFFGTYDEYLQTHPLKQLERKVKS